MNDATAPHISIVVPVYGSREVLPELHHRVVSSIKKVTSEYELILVNDASPDGAWETIQDLAKQDPNVQGLNLSRNFGQYPAITAGLEASRGEWVVVMDCDLQDQPEEIERMYAKAKEGYFVVVGSRQKRHDGPLRLFVSRCFYATLSYLSGTHQDGTLANFGMYHRRVIDSIISIPDHMRYFSVMVRWVGFRTATIPIEHAPRKGGKSGYSFSKLFSLATDIILAYSEKPLRLIIKMGLFVLIFSTIYLVFVFGREVMLGEHNPMSFLFGSLWFIFGFLTTMIGIVALYLGKIFEEVKKRPIYIIQEET